MLSHWTLTPPWLLMKYQQVPQQLRITDTTAGLRDLPPVVPLKGEVVVAL